MADDPIVTDAGWTCTITAGDTAVSLAGILGTASGAERGDFLLGADGSPLALAAVAAGVTLLRPAPAAAAGTVQFAWMRGPHRSLEALSTIKSNDVYARLSLMASDGRSIPVIAWQNAPPSTPAHGDRYLVATGSGAWAGQNGRFAEYNTSGTAGWLFVTPKAGWAATINGSLVRLQFTGTAWGATSPIAGTTTVAGRLARFTDTAGGMGQSAMSEDGSGNVALGGRLTAFPAAFVPTTGGVVNAAFTASGTYGGGYLLSESTLRAGMWMQNDGGLGTGLYLGVGTTSGLVSVLYGHSAGVTIPGTLSVRGQDTDARYARLTGATFTGQTAVEATLVGDLWMRMRNLSANGRAGFLFGNDANPAYGAFFLNGSALSDYAGANSFNLGAFGAVPFGLFTSAQLRLTIAAGGTLRFHAYGAGALVTDAGGNVSVSSSQELKEDIQEWDDGDDSYLDVSPVSFRYNARSGMDRMNRYYGYIAEWMEPHLPQCVGMNPDGTPSFNWFPLVAKMTRTIKRLKARLDALETH
jgi:hypothetical protein